MKVAEILPFTYTGADLYALCSDAMLKAITKQARYVDERIRDMEQRGEGKVSTAWWFDNMATDDDVKVVVRAEDFDEARRELVGSVRYATFFAAFLSVAGTDRYHSAKELEHYQHVREQFEQPDSMPAKEDKGKGKAADYSNDDYETPTYSGKGKGKAIMLDQHGHEREFGSNGWEDPAGNDDDELYRE